MLVIVEQLGIVLALLASLVTLIGFILKCVKDKRESTGKLEVEKVDIGYPDYLDGDSYTYSNEGYGVAFCIITVKNPFSKKKYFNEDKSLSIKVKKYKEIQFNHILYSKKIENNSLYIYALNNGTTQENDETIKIEFKINGNIVKETEVIYKLNEGEHKEIHREILTDEILNHLKDTNNNMVTVYVNNFRLCNVKVDVDENFHMVNDCVCPPVEPNDLTLYSFCKIIEDEDIIINNGVNIEGEEIKKLNVVLFSEKSAEFEISIYYNGQEKGVFSVVINKPYYHIESPYVKEFYINKRYEKFTFNSVVNIYSRK